MAPFHETWQEYYYSQAHRSRVVRARKERADWESRKRTEAREKLLRQATENDFHRRNELAQCSLAELDGMLPKFREWHRKWLSIEEKGNEESDELSRELYRLQKVDYIGVGAETDRFLRKCCMQNHQNSVALRRECDNIEDRMEQLYLNLLEDSSLREPNLQRLSKLSRRQEYDRLHSIYLHGTHWQ